MSATAEHTLLPLDQEGLLVELAAVTGSTSEVTLVTGDGHSVPLPAELRDVLSDVVQAMALGQAITIAPHQTVMTTQQAADFLGVSRPTLVRLLEDDQIPYTRPGRHRRVLLADLVEYQERARQRRRAILDEMTRESADDPSLGSGFIATR